MVSYQVLVEHGENMTGRHILRHCHIIARPRPLTQLWLLPAGAPSHDARMTQFTPFRLIAAALILALLPLAAGAEIRVKKTYIDVYNDRGGNVLEMVKTRHQLENSGKEVRIRGYCRSACTMLTTMRNACLGPNATIGFHAPRIPNTKIIPPYVDQVMANFYRNGILRKWNAEWRYSLDMVKISAREYHRLDPATRICAQ